MNNRIAKATLSGALTIYTAEENRRLLLDASGGGGGLELDLGSIAECDTAGVQLLCSASVASAASGARLALLNLPSCVVNACNAIGIDPQTLNPSPK